MDKKLERIRQVAKNSGYCMKYRKIARKNIYVLSFFANDFLDGFSFSVNVNDSDDENAFIGNVSDSIFEVLKNFSVENETENTLQK